ncbi:MAG: hypothetical protein P8N76_07010 [Pirellulaceae bacterium]|nr:hypothetical protein [Pirellulaceae bacterium]
MARRIIVVLSQAARANSTQRDFESSLVAELLMVHGLEVTLIPDLTRLKPGDTGLLCLEGITSDMVMLSWIDATQAHQQLAQLEIHGRPGRTAWGSLPIVAVEHARTIFHIDLRELPAVSDCCDEIKRIREEATMKTYDLGITLNDPATTPPVNDVPIDSPPSSEDSAHGRNSLTASESSSDHPPTVNESDKEDEEDEEQLDRWMQQLDDWDS